MHTLHKLLYLTAIVISPTLAQTQLNLQTPAPNPVANATATIIGNAGNGTYYYWVIANYPTGGSLPTGPAVAQFAPSPDFNRFLGNVGSNFAIINATGYTLPQWRLATGQDIHSTP